MGGGDAAVRAAALQGGRPPFPSGHGGAEMSSSPSRGAEAGDRDPTGVHCPREGFPQGPSGEQRPGELQAAERKAEHRMHGPARRPGVSAGSRGAGAPPACTPEFSRSPAAAGDGNWTCGLADSDYDGGWGSEALPTMAWDRFPCSELAPRGLRAR